MTQYYDSTIVWWKQFIIYTGVSDLLSLIAALRKWMWPKATDFTSECRDDLHPYVVGNLVEIPVDVTVFYQLTCSHKTLTLII